MARARRTTRTAARGGAGTRRSQRAEAERPAASRRASAAAANRQRDHQHPQAAETEEVVSDQPAAAAEPGTQETLKPQPAAQPATRPAGNSSSRRAKVAGRSSQRPSAAKGSSRRNAVQDRPSTRRSSRREVDPASAWRQKAILGGIVLLLLAVVGGLLAWPGIRRDMLLSQLDAAPDAAAAQAVADEYLEYVAYHPGHVQAAVSAGRGPASARIHMARQIESPDMLLTLSADQAVDDDDRAVALTAAAELIEAGSASTAYVDQERLQAWAIQPDRQEKHPELAMAAAHLIAARKTDNAAEVLSGVIRDADQHPAILAAAVSNLPKVIDHGNVGFALLLLSSPNNDAVLASDDLLQAITTAVRATHVDRIFTLLDHADVRVQAAGTRFLRGNGIASAGPDQAESIGQRIAPYLSAEMHQDKPQVFTEALKVVAALSLTGARDQLFAILPVLPADSEDATVVAQILGRNFIRSGDDREQISNAVLAGLAAALDESASREVAAAALQQVNVRELAGLRSALEACIAHGTDPACMDAAHHITGKLYQRSDVIAKLDRDVEAWRGFLAQDRPRFEEFQAIHFWLQENAEVRATDPPEKIRDGKLECDRMLAMLEGWLKAGGDPMPLGLTKPMVESAQRNLKTVQYSLMKATPGL